MPDFNGTNGPDNWTGTNADETAHGGGGDDRLDAGIGNDFVYGEDGNDQLTGGPGVDLLDGGAGDDILYININSYGIPDYYTGDQFVGGTGTDTLTLYNGQGVAFDLTQISIGADIEQLDTSYEVVRLSMAQLAQFSSVRGVLRLTDSGSIVLGAKFEGGMQLADGDDNFSFAGGTPSVQLYIRGNGGNDTLIGSDNADTLFGDSGADRLEGRIGADWLEGGSGNDVVIGGDGNDTLIDGLGDDMLEGGAGDDTIQIDLEDGFTELDRASGGSGIDTLNAIPPYASSGKTIDLQAFNPAADIEILNTPTAVLIGTPDRLNQFQRVTAYGVTLTAAGSVALSDRFTAYRFTLSDLGNRIDLTETGQATYWITGGAGADEVAGGIGTEFFSGGGGNDLVHAMGGADELSGGAGIDWLDGGAGDDLLLVKADEGVEAGDHFSGGAGEDILQLEAPSSAGDAVANLASAIIDADVERLYAQRDVLIRTDQLSAFTTIMGGRVIKLADGGALNLSGKEARGALVLSDAGNQVALSSSSRLDTVTGGSAADRIDGEASGFAQDFAGGGGDDVLIGGAAGDRLDGGAGDDLMRGGLGDDIYLVDSEGDQVVEQAGEGQDLIHTYVNFTLASGIEIETLQAHPSAAPGVVALTGNERDNRLIGHNGADLLDGGAGADYMAGGYGDDTYWIDDAGDVVEEYSGAGSDTLYTSISYVLPTFLFVETVRAAPGTAPINLTGTVWGNNLIGNAGANRLTGDWNNDRLEGGEGNDTLSSVGGLDQLLGGEGNDGLVFGAGFGAGDTADGGAGSDTLVLQGNYAGLPLAGMTNVEVLLLASGADTRFGDLAGNRYDYRIAASDVIVTAGATLIVSATGLLAGEDLAFDGSAELNGHFRIFAGMGIDDLKGGAGNDGFFFGADNNLTGADRVLGGAGTDSIALRGNYSLSFDAESFSGVEVLTFLSGHTNEYGGPIAANGFDYDVTLADGNVAAGALLQVIGVNLHADESLRFDGRAEADGSLRILSGAGDDTLFGGAGSDTLYGALGADQMDGGAGADVYLYRTAQDSTAAARDTIVFGAGDRIDLLLIDANSATAANDAFTFVGANAFSSTAGELRAYQSGAEWIVEGDVNGDGTADLVLTVTSAAPLTSADFVP